MLRNLLIILITNLSLNASGTYIERDTQRYYTDSQRSVIYIRDKGLCGICDGFVTLRTYHADHIKPWSKGGRTSVSNAQVAHAKCNQSKGSKYPYLRNTK